MPRPIYKPKLPERITPQAHAPGIHRANTRRLQKFDPIVRAAPKNGHGTPADYNVGG